MMMRWDNVLSASVPDRILEQFSKLEIAAHFLFEMTFLGYSNNMIQDRIQRFDVEDEEDDV